MTRHKEIVVGTRGSTLALRQTEEVLTQLRLVSPETRFVVTSMKTGGDKASNAPLASLGVGTFVKEIEEALLRGEIDLAVHSLKDLPSKLPDGLAIGAIGKREDPRDVLVDRWDLPLDRLSSGARIGTSSPRRTAQLRSVRPDLATLPIRGNVDTRLRKARGEDYDGVVLAAAGILRLGRQNEIAQYLPPEVFVPAVGQGALAVEVRADDKEVLGIASRADHRPTRLAVTAERSFLAFMGGGCAVPLSAYGQVLGQELRLVAMASTVDGQRVFHVSLVADASGPEDAGKRLAEKLLDSGARDILKVATA